MRSVRLTGPDIASLALVEEDTPAPGPGEILVEMQAASLNYRDLLVMRNFGGRAGGLIPLSDGAGVVAAVGAGVTEDLVGTLVAGCFHPRWHYGSRPRSAAQEALGGGRDGVLATHKIFRADEVVRAPRGYDARAAATLPCAALTAWNALIGTGAGDTVLTLGSGGVSTFAIAFAKAAGCRVIATSSSDEKLERLRALGADETINYHVQPDWDRTVLSLTDGRGADRIVEVGGGGTLPRSLNAIAPGGEVALIGVLTSGQIDPTAILFSGASVRSILVGSRAMFEDMNRVIEQHAITPVIDRIFPLEEVQDAYRHLERAGHFGKILIDIN